MLIPSSVGYCMTLISIEAGHEPRQHDRNIQKGDGLMNRPNVLIFMTDQQRGDTALAGSTAVVPNLDRFRTESVTFSRAYCPSPHCCPSRATFFSGLYPSRHGVWNNVNVGNTLSRGLQDGVRLWCEDFREAGYRMDFSGKWHVSAEETPEDRGWTCTNEVKPDLPRAEGAVRPKPALHEWRYYVDKHHLLYDGDRKPAQILRPGYGVYTHYGVNENPFNDRGVVDQGLEVMRSRQPGDEPWCQFIGTLGPHDPYFVPQRFLDMYDVDEIELPANFHDRMWDKPGLYRRTRDRFDQLTEFEHRNAIRHYLAFCSYQDALFGEVLDALKASGEEENTIVVYVSDHGDYMAEHGLWCKGLPCFSGAYHVPAIVRWPAGVCNPGRQVDEFVSLADFAPTLSELCNVDCGCEFDGESLAPLLRDEASEDWRDAIFTQTNGNELYGIQRSVMTREWKYVYNGFDYDELYNLQDDPDETKNMIDDPECSEIVRELSRRLWRFAHDHDDVCINHYIMVALASHGPGVAFEE